ncbi:MAG: hypothetical protein HWD61_02195 [Parachlamydiaceae bacterium]|nr:MAG: hypothetical protein HWD61_02195 [Parachlamydiaceae bacterium]
MFAKISTRNPEISVVPTFPAAEKANDKTTQIGQKTIAEIQQKAKKPLRPYD